jgi:hypothetical protein
MKSQKVGRLALREEGENWNAYYAMPDTMDGALPLGSIKIGFAKRSDTTKRAFIDLMRECVADVIEDATGVRPTWPEGIQPAPEHERSGNA